jgi:divalent metal cation (Fe/Co/Zn/Cd) transporter
VIIPTQAGSGIGLAAFTAPTMPLLANAKRRLGNQLQSAATVKEAAQTRLCAYLSIALLLGLGANALTGWWWADPLTALVIAAVAAKEGRENWHGEGCCDAC